MIPIFPGHYCQPGLIKIRPNEYFSLNYLGKNNYGDLVGTKYDTGNNLTLFMKKMNPGFIKNNFDESIRYRQ